MLEYIPRMITDDQNAQIIEMPDKEEIKNTVFGLNSDMQEDQMNIQEKDLRLAGT